MLRKRRRDHAGPVSSMVTRGLREVSQPNSHCPVSNLLGCVDTSDNLIEFSIQGF